MEDIDKRIEKLLESLIETRHQLDETKKIVSETAALQKKTDEQLKKTDEQLKKTDEQLKKTDEQLKKTDAKLWSLGLNIGTAVEEAFIDIFNENPELGNIKFDYVESNIKGHYKTTQDEFDIVMYNGNSIALFEIKHKVHPNDLTKLVTQKVNNFKILFPQYAKYKFYLGIGGLSIPTEVKAEAIKKGVAILKQKGDIVKVEDKNLIAY
jgi:hypothetical protein